MNVNDILKKYTIGEISLDDANKELKEAGACFHLNPDKNVLTDDEINNGTAGLLDTGTGSLDKVYVKDGELVNADVGTMNALLTMGGKLYRVNGKKIFEI